MTDGFQDTTGTFPRRQTQNQSGVNPRARSNASEEIQSAANRSARVASTRADVVQAAPGMCPGAAWKLPEKIKGFKNS